MNTYASFSRMTCLPGRRDAVIEILLEGARLLEEFEGCTQYAVFKDATDEDVACVSEIWEDAAAHAASLTDPRLGELIMTGTPMLATLPQITQLSPVGGKGL